MRTAYVFLAFIILISCKKLDSEKMFLKSSCEACQNEVEEEIGALKGIHYVKYDADNETLTIHYERNKNRIQAEAWLMANGHIESIDTTVNIFPSCCPQKDSLNETGSKE